MTIRLPLCYIIQAVAWDRAEKYRCPWYAAKNRIKKLLTNVDEHDILDKLFQANAHRWNNKIKKLLTRDERGDNLLKLSQTTTKDKNFDNWTIDNNPEDSRYNSDSVRSTRGLRRRRLQACLQDWLRIRTRCTKCIGRMNGSEQTCLWAVGIIKRKFRTDWQLESWS